MTRTKNDIIRHLAQNYDLNSVTARQVITDVLSGIVDACMEHGKIELRKFGTFKVSWRSPRVARNPRTNEAIKLPGRYVMTFEPSEKVMDRITDATSKADYQPKKPLVAVKEQRFIASIT